METLYCNIRFGSPTYDNKIVTLYMILNLPQ